MKKTYTLLQDYPRHGRRGDTVELPEAAAKYLVLAGTLVEGKVKPAAPSDGPAPKPSAPSDGPAPKSSTRGR